MNVIIFFKKISLTILCFSVLTSFTYNNSASAVEKASNSFYNPNALFFTSDKANVNFHDFKELLPNNTVLYGQIFSNQDLRAVLLTGSTSKPQLIIGRYFTEHDFKENSAKVAVIGQNVKTEQLNDKEVYFHEETPYEVIGKMGYPIPTKLDKTIFINMNAELQGNNFARFVIDGKDLKQNLEFLGHEHVWGQVIVSENEHGNFLHASNISKGPLFFTFCLNLFFLLSVALILYFSLMLQKSELMIKRINGYSIAKIRKDIQLSSLHDLVFASLLGGISTYLFSLNRFLFSWTTILICTLFFSLLIMSFTYFYSRNLLLSLSVSIMKEE